ncbi:MAG: hypothetical protein PHC92_01455 [Syntrophomonadaceae bacterium]|nr:hypothetical protein [Syntrophomonadaceae bacterium]MDD3022652.1 hypothetical protein [Syntrophomonadaceae bacterium]
MIAAMNSTGMLLKEDGKKRGKSLKENSLITFCALSEAKGMNINMFPASLSVRDLLSKQVAGYNEALSRYSCILKLLRSFFWCLNPSSRCNGAKENQRH